jgi:hypothetical protein
VPSLNFLGPKVGTSRPHLDGNDAGNRELRSSDIALTLLPGEYLALRWYDGGGPAGTGAALAIDDFSVSFAAAAVPESSAALLVGGIAIATGSVAAVRRRRRRIPRVN